MEPGNIIQDITEMSKGNKSLTFVASFLEYYMMILVQEKTCKFWSYIFYLRELLLTATVHGLIQEE